MAEKRVGITEWKIFGMLADADEDFFFFLLKLRGIVVGNGQGANCSY